jgi:hypothetical protein
MLASKSFSALTVKNVANHALHETTNFETEQKLLFNRTAELPFTDAAEQVY